MRYNSLIALAQLYLHSVSSYQKLNMIVGKYYHWVLVRDLPLAPALSHLPHINKYLKAPYLASPQLIHLTSL
jgi:hypothetical protein